MDLAKVGKITTIRVESTRDHTENAVNELLETGWVILSVKIIENPDRKAAWLIPALTVFVLGKPREKQKSEAASPPESAGVEVGIG